MSNIPKVSKGAIIRTLVLAITMINSICLMFGKQILPIGEDDIENTVNAVYAGVSAVLVVLASVAAWWKNNSFTKKARLKDKK